MRIMARILFALKHRTWRRISPCGAAFSDLAVYHKGREIRIKRRCPHQGLPLDKGYFQEDSLVCPWHGCRFSLSAPDSARPYVPTFNPDTKP